MDEIKMPGFDTPKPGLTERYEIPVSPMMSRALKYIGMVIGDEELMNREPDDTKFVVPQERERLQKIISAAWELTGDGHVTPFLSTFRMINGYAQQLNYA